MIPELEVVVLTEDLPEFGLVSGDIGTVVHAVEQAGYLVEFMDPAGNTIDVVPVEPLQVRIATPEELAARRTKRAASRTTSP